MLQGGKRHVLHVRGDLVPQVAHDIGRKPRLDVRPDIVHRQVKGQQAATLHKQPQKRLVLSSDRCVREYLHIVRDADTDESIDRRKEYSQTRPEAL
jgi:hypothetical protein